MKTIDKERALQLHKRAIIIDALEFAQYPSYYEADIDKIMAAGVTACNLTVPGPNDSLAVAINKITTWKGLFRKHADKLIQVLTSRDIEAAKKEGKLGIIIGSQNADILGSDLSLLATYEALGMRIMQPTYTFQNLLGEGCGERTDSGFSLFGLEWVKEMNRLRMAIDLSHCGDQVTLDGIKYSEAPVVITHSNPRALVNNPRNKTDEAIRALADKGGVIGITTYGPFCEIKKGVRSTWADFLDLIDYTVKLVGVDHVGFGTDFAIWTKEQFDAWAAAQLPFYLPTGGYFGRNVFANEEGGYNYRELHLVTEGLVGRGYSDQDIEKILGLNFLNVFREIWGG